MPAKYEQLTVTHEFLNNNPSAFFVYGDNQQRQGMAGAAALRNHPKSIGFVTKKAPDGKPKSCFTPEEYAKPFFDQLKQLAEHIKKNSQHKFYISKLGAGYANRYYIWEKLIHHNIIEELGSLDNVVFCWEEEKLVSE
jgi:hypothetical protein